MKNNRLLTVSALALGLATGNAHATGLPVLDIGALTEFMAQVAEYAQLQAKTLMAGQDEGTANAAQANAKGAAAQAQMDYQQTLAGGQEALRAQIAAQQTFGGNGVIDSCDPASIGIDLGTGNSQSAMNVAQASDGVYRAVGDNATVLAAQAGVSGAVPIDSLGRAHAFKGSSEILKDFSDANVKKQDVVVATVKPDSMVYADAATEKKAKLIFDRGLNPAPPLNLMDAQGIGVTHTSGMEDSTLAGRKYKELRKVYDSKALLPTRIVNKYWADQVGSINYGQWAADRWAKAAGSGSSYYGVNGSNMMSPLSALNLEVVSRYESATFYKEVMGMDQPEKLVREMLLIEAARNKIKFETLQYMQALAAMKSVAAVDHLNETLGQTLDGLRVEAHKQNASGATN